MQDCKSLRAAIWSVSPRNNTQTHRQLLTAHDIHMASQNATISLTSLPTFWQIHFCCCQWCHITVTGDNSYSMYSHVTTYIELVSLNNLWRRIIHIIMCLVVLVPLKALNSTATTTATADTRALGQCRLLPRRIWSRFSLDTDDFHNLTATFLFYTCDKIFMKMRSVFPEIRANMWRKHPMLQCRRIHQKLPGSTSVRGWLPKFNQFFLGHRYISQWRREGGVIRPGRHLCRGRHLEGQKYGILKFGRFWQIGVCIFLAVATDQPNFHCIT